MREKWVDVPTWKWREMKERFLRVTTLLPHSLRVDGGLDVDCLQVTWSVVS